MISQSVVFPGCGRDGARPSRVFYLFAFALAFALGAQALTVSLSADPELPAPNLLTAPKYRFDKGMADWVNKHTNDVSAVETEGRGLSCFVKNGKSVWTGAPLALVRPGHTYILSCEIRPSKEVCTRASSDGGSGLGCCLTYWSKDWKRAVSLGARTDGPDKWFRICSKPVTIPDWIAHGQMTVGLAYSQGSGYVDNIELVEAYSELSVHVESAAAIRQVKVVDQNCRMVYDSGVLNGDARMWTHRLRIEAAYRYAVFAVDAEGDVKVARYPAVDAEGDVKAARDPAVDAVTFRDNGKGLRNPGMGWVHYVYGNRLWAYGANLKADDVIEEFPGLSTVYFKLNWCDLEPEDGVFRWDLIDTFAAPWTARGFKIAFRVSCCDHRQPYATPKWVYDAGAKGFRFTIWSKTYPDPNGKGMEPLRYSDPVFLAKLEDFVTRFARRYDGRDEVAWVEVSSFGLWGEGHTIGTSHLSKEETAGIARKHIALWKRHFRRTQLVMSDDVSGDFERCGNYPIMDEAAAQGIGMRDDSVFCVKRDPPWLHDDMAQRFWPTLPVILEHEHWAISEAQGNWRPDVLPRCVEDYHASYLSAHWFPREYLAKNRALIDRINRRLGYRLLPCEVRYPTRVKIGEPCAIESRWQNRGVAPCRERPALAWTLKDATGAVRWIWSDESFDAASLPVGAPDAAPVRRHVTKAVFGNAATFPRAADGLYGSMERLKVLPDFLKGTDRVPTIEPGRYTLWLSLGRYDGTPQIALPVDGEDGARRYRVGELEVCL